jgi:peptide/nickel transport system substrate-binding protein
MAASRRSGRRRALLAAVLALSVVAAACGTDNSGEDAGDGGSEQSAGTVAQQAGADERAEEGDPVKGGVLRYGIEADSANGWAPYVTSCAISCRMIFRAISDPLFGIDTNAEAQGYLVETAEMNDAGTEHTWTLREGIKFHDGTPLDGEAVAYNIATCWQSDLTRAAYFMISKLAFEGQTVTVTTSIPAPDLAFLFREEVCGMMFSKQWLETLESNPLRTPEKAAKTPFPAITAPASGDQAKPVGLGAFKFVSYTPGNGNSFVTERNDDYWRGDGPGATGEGLPHLDGIEFTVAVDGASRASGLESGQFDIIHTANGEEIAELQGNDDLVTLTANDYGETSYVLLNVAEGTNEQFSKTFGLAAPAPMDPEGKNATNPLVNENCRIALAHAVDRDRLADERNAGLAVAANGPFSPGQFGHMEDSGYPEFDVDAANTAMDKCLAEIGKPVVEFAFNTTNDPFNVESNQLIESMWKEAFGDKVKVTITPIEQGQYIGLALVGAFNAQGWRNHGGFRPIEQSYWWLSSSASPMGTLALNFGRFQDPEIDAAMLDGITNTDEAARRKAAETVNQSFAKHVWNFWSWWTLWGVVANTNVHTITQHQLPGDGGETVPIIAGKHYVAQVWCTDGNCSA